MPSRILNGLAEVQPLPWLANRSAAPTPVPRRPPPEQAVPAPSPVAEFEATLASKENQAYENGRRAGAEAARAQLQSEVQASVQRLAETIADLASTRAETMRRAESDTVRLAVEIARRVLHRELTLDPTALGALVKAALEKLQAQEIYRVRVHPGQERIVKSCLDQTGRGQAVAVVPDPMQPEGGVIFEISRGAMDASVDTQLAEIERGLVDQLEVRS